MEENRSPTRASLDQALQSLLGSASCPANVRDVHDISPGIGTSRVFRVFIEAPGGRAVPNSLILKVPDWEGETLLDSRDPLLGHREQAFFESRLAARLPSGLCAPDVLLIERREGRTWIWMEDLAPCLERKWRPEDAIEAARRCALLDETYRREGKALAEVEWLEREGYSAYSHHIPRAHENLDRVSAHPLWSQLFSPDEINKLHRGLNISVDALAELRRFSSTLVHGDYHIGNLGFDDQGALVCIDWAHVGLAPRGSDIAVLSSLYHAFGGTGGHHAMEMDREIIGAYVQEVERLTGEQGLLSTVSHTFALWHVTWGLHIRLGPGMSYLLAREPTHNTEVDKAAADIREGCERALLYLPRVSG